MHFLHSLSTLSSLLGIGAQLGAAPLRVFLRSGSRLPGGSFSELCICRPSIPNVGCPDFERVNCAYAQNQHGGKEHTELQRFSIAES